MPTIVHGALSTDAEALTNIIIVMKASFAKRPPGPAGALVRARPRAGAGLASSSLSEELNKEGGRSGATWPTSVGTKDEPVPDSAGASRGKGVSKEGMAGAASTLKPSPAVFFFFFFPFFLLYFRIVSFFLSFSFFLVPGDRCRPPDDLLLTLETLELRTVLMDRERGDLRLLPHSRGVASWLCRALQRLPNLHEPLSQCGQT